eukprot:15438052-Alexandrium_andersonii.AAC.1
MRTYRINATQALEHTVPPSLRSMGPCVPSGLIRHSDPLAGTSVMHPCELSSLSTVLRMCEVPESLNHCAVPRST